VEEKKRKRKEKYRKKKKKKKKKGNKFFFLIFSFSFLFLQFLLLLHFLLERDHLGDVQDRLADFIFKKEETRAGNGDLSRLGSRAPLWNGSRKCADRNQGPWAGLL